MRLILLVAGLMLISCHNSKTTKNTEPLQPSVQAGADRDPHGCIPSAGYTWSVLKKDCIRLFETGIRLQPQDSTMSQSVSAFIIFNADQSKAELFIPGRPASVVLDRRGSEGVHSWESGELKLYPSKGYLLKEKDKVIYHGE